MSDLVAHVKSAEGFYLQEPGSWTRNREEATVFFTTQEAVSAALRQPDKKEGLVVIVKFNDTGHEIWVPVQR